MLVFYASDISISGVALSVATRDDARMDPGQALRAARGKHTQQEIAARMGVSQNAISDWERGRNRAGLDDIAAFEEAAGRPRGWVLRAAGYVAENAGVVEAIRADPLLEDVFRDALISLYQHGVEHARNG